MCFFWHPSTSLSCLLINSSKPWCPATISSHSRALVQSLTLKHQFLAFNLSTPLCHEHNGSYRSSRSQLKANRCTTLRHATSRLTEPPSNWIAQRIVPDSGSPILGRSCPYSSSYSDSSPRTVSSFKSIYLALTSSDPTLLPLSLV